MTGKTKLLIAILIAIGSISVITVLANTIYFPVIVKSPTITPTATFTATATLTNTPSATPTRTPTPTPGVFISEIVYDPADPLDEYIEIENTGNNSVDMDGWWIKVDSSGARYDFSDFTLGGDKSVKVWTKVGTDTATNLYWGRTEDVWDDDSDTAYLRDDEGDVVDTFEY